MVAWPFDIFVAFSFS